jgi:CheY-like chemotaxis protein
VTALIVDDDLDMRALVRMVLEAAHLGIDVVAEAVDGNDAVAVFDRLAPPPVPTIVILDNRMPYLSGLEVAQEMRRRMPVQHIILFSAHLTPEIEAVARDVGIDACLSKRDVAQLPHLVISLTGPHLAE